MITIYIPTKQPGDTGPKPMTAKIENTIKNFNWALFIVLLKNLFQL
jgi:hypothetical protein